MWSVLLVAAALAQSPCTWSAEALKGGGFRVEGVREGDVAPLSVGVQPWGKSLPTATARFEGQGPLQVEVSDASVAVRGALASGEAALYPVAPMRLSGGVQLDPSAPVQALSLGPDGLRITTRLRRYTPTTPAEATVSCDALSLVRGDATPPPELPARDLVIGTWPVLASPGGAALGELRCESEYDCPAVRLMGAGNGQSQVELRWPGAQLVGWVPDAALREPPGGVGGILGGMLGGSAGNQVRNYACPATDLWVTSVQGQVSRVGALQAGAVLEAASSETAYAPIWLDGSGWLVASPHRLALAKTDLARCEDRGASNEPAPSGLVGKGGNSGGSGPIILGALSKQDIDKVVLDGLDDVRRCYQKGVRKKPDLAGRVVVKFIIEPDGTVREATIKSSTLGSEKVERCVASEIEALRFPKPDGGGVVIVSYPFVFAPG